MRPDQIEKWIIGLYADKFRLLETMDMSKMKEAKYFAKEIVEFLKRNNLLKNG